MPDVPAAQDELAALRAANARLREVIEAKDAMLAVRDAQITVLARQVESLTERIAWMVADMTVAQVWRS